MQGNETLCLASDLFLDEWKGCSEKDNSAVCAKKEDMGAAALPLLSVWTLWTLQNSGEQHGILPVLTWAWTCISHWCALSAMAGAFQRWCILSSCSLKCSLVEVIRQRQPPPDQCPRYSPNKDSLDISKKYSGQYPDCSRGVVCPQHDLVPLTEPHILFPAPSIWWLQMNWRDIFNQSTPHIR